MSKYIVDGLDWQEACNGIMCSSCPFQKNLSCKIGAYIRSQPVYEEKRKEGEGKMMEKRKLSQFEQIMLASAYNLKNYCKNTSCSNCLFRHGVSKCILTTPDNPYNWELYQINREEGEAE